MEAAPRLDTSRPSNLRLAAFALTALGALLMGLGSLLRWVTVGIADQASLRTVSPGTDLSAGKITLGAAVFVLVLLIVSRFVADLVRLVIAIVMIAAGALCTALAVWFIIAAPDHYSPVDDERLVSLLAQATGKSVEDVRQALAQVIDQLGGYTHVGPGPWIAAVGGILVIAGGLLTLRWVQRLRSDVPGEPVG
jgi:hypothetical protein